MFGNKIVTDENKINDLLSRGVEEVIGKDHLVERLKDGEKLRVKLGIDPTSPNIHIGRAILLWKLREFQDLGHTAILIVGDFTGQIGDTSDKESERPMLSEKEVNENLKDYFKQAFKILDKNKTETQYNSEWLKKLGFMEIGKMADRFGLHEFSSRELIKKRIDAGKRVSLREVLYPLMQGYDSVAVKADVELGGTDQRFNLLAGRAIQPLYNQHPQDIVITKFPLMGTDGRKMSSSWGNVINITDEPNDMFGKVMSIRDELMPQYLELATRLSHEEIKTLVNQINSGANQRNVKVRLAWEIVALYHGEKDAQKAKDEWEKVFTKREMPSEIETISGVHQIITSVIAGIVQGSNTEAKNLLDQGAIKINDIVIKDWGYELKEGDILQIGPKTFRKIK